MSDCEIRKYLEKIEEEFTEAQEKYKRQMKELRESCEHEFESFSSYDGTEYCCKKCEMWKL